MITVRITDPTVTPPCIIDVDVSADAFSQLADRLPFCKFDRVATTVTSLRAAVATPAEQPKKRRKPKRKPAVEASATAEARPKRARKAKAAEARKYQCRVPGCGKTASPRNDMYCGGDGGHASTLTAAEKREHKGAGNGATASPQAAA